MTEKQAKAEKPVEPAVEAEPKPQAENEEETPTGEQETPTGDTDNELIKKLRKIEAESAKTIKRMETELKKYQDAEREREQSEMSDLQKAEEKAKELAAELDKVKRQNLQIAAATAAGLPLELAPRLQGETIEEMQADAKTILEIAAKATKKPAPKLDANNLPDGSEQEETEAEKRKRLLGW